MCWPMKKLLEENEMQIVYDIMDCFTNLKTKIFF